MKKVGQLMNDLGFNKNGSDSAKEAFIKYLIKQSAGIEVQTPTEKKLIQEAALESPKKILHFPQQLEFVFDETDTTNRKKA